MASGREAENAVFVRWTSTGRDPWWWQRIAGMALQAAAHPDGWQSLLSQQRRRLRLQQHLPWPRMSLQPRQPLTSVRDKPGESVCRGMGVDVTEDDWALQPRALQDALAGRGTEADGQLVYEHRRLLSRWVSRCCLGLRLRSAASTHSPLPSMVMLTFWILQLHGRKSFAHQTILDHACCAAARRLAESEEVLESVAHGLLGIGSDSSPVVYSLLRQDAASLDLPMQVGRA